MYDTVMQVLPPLIFLAFSLLIIKLKNRYFEQCPQTWRILTLGGLVLLVAGVTRLVHNSCQNLNLAMPKLYASLSALEICGYIIGSGLVLLGFFKWSSAFSDARKTAALRLRQLICMKAVLSILNHHKDLDAIFKHSLPCVMNVMRYKMGVIFRPTFRSSEMILVTHWGITAKNLSSLYSLYSTSPLYQEVAKSKEVTSTSDVTSLPEYGTLIFPEDKIRSFACVPIKFWAWRQNRS
jgi:hypothetical protein